MVGFGAPPEARRRVVEAMGPDARWAVVIHPAAWVSPSARLEPGAVVLAGSVVNAGAVVGSHAIVNSGVTVEHDVRVGAFSHLAPGAVVGGGTAIGDDTIDRAGRGGPGPHRHRVARHGRDGRGRRRGRAGRRDRARRPGPPQIRLVTDELARCIVRNDATIRDGLEAVDRGAGGIVLVVDDAGRLVAIATDGDLRRAILAGRGLDDPLAPVANERFVAVDSGRVRVDALDLMRGRRIAAIPVVDADGRPVALHQLQGFLRHEPSGPTAR